MKRCFLKIFCFIDRITELKKNESLTAFFKLKGNEEFLKDHFSDFPVMPGVLLLETLKQAAASLLERSKGTGKVFFRLVSAEEVKFGQFVKPGSELKIFVRFLKKEGDFQFFDGRIDLLGGPEDPSRGKALSASFALAPVSA